MQTIVICQFLFYIENSVWGAHLFSVVHDIAKDHRDEVIANSKLKSRLLKALRSMGFEQNACLLEQQLDTCATNTGPKSPMPSDGKVGGIDSSRTHLPKVPFPFYLIKK